ncbi:hypothetical protein FJZ19_03225 [Candidatus Pacearchaeota archaeon]|nr:hypothetical protein [Candidatus Pacearchaeota archaeon]
MNWKKLGVYSVLLLMQIGSLIMAVSALTPFSAPESEKWLTESQFYAVISPYLVPDGFEGLGGLIIGIVTLVIIFSIFMDVIYLATPFSKPVVWIMTIGFAIIAIFSKLSVIVAGWIFVVGATAFAWAGALAGLLTIVLAILILFFIFFTGEWIRKWVVNIRLRRKGLEKQEAAIEKGQNVASAVKMAEAMTGKKVKVQ